MSLMTCKECGSKVSTRAAACPSCGAPIKATAGAVSAGCGCLIMIIVGVICAGVFSTPNSPTTSPTRTPTGPLTAEQQPQHNTQEKVDGEQRKADRKAAEKKQKQNLDRFMATLSAAGVNNSVIEYVSVKDEMATITVANTWHITAYQIRLQAAQNLWQAWAKIASPNNPDKARIKLIDLNGNEVGGSRILAGSLIWVQEN